MLTAGWLAFFLSIAGVAFIGLCFLLRPEFWRVLDWLDGPMPPYATPFPVVLETGRRKMCLSRTHAKRVAFYRALYSKKPLEITETENEIVLHRAFK